MRQCRTPLRGAALAAAGTSLLGCGSGNFDPAPGFGKALASAGYVTPRRVQCPAAVSATRGTVFHCTFTDPDGMSYDAQARVTSVNGTTVNFHIVVDRQLHVGSAVAIPGP